MPKRVLAAVCLVHLNVVCAFAQAAAAQQPAMLTLDELLSARITSASLHEESMADAPASITVITAADIKTYGYRTLSEVLAGVRGFYDTYDHSYHVAGARGLSFPGDWGTRILVLIDGHNIADTVYNSALVGRELPVDLSLVKRIEVVHGPSSALYGSNAVLATVNVITVTPSDADSSTVTVGGGSGLEREVQGSLSLGTGDRRLLVAASAFGTEGQRHIDIPELGAGGGSPATAIGMDAERSYRMLARFTAGRWDVLALGGVRGKVQPVSWGETLFNDPATRIEDARAFVEAGYTREWDGMRSLHWRASLDTYRYSGNYRLPSDDVVAESRELDRGEWIGSSLRYRTPFGPAGVMTAGLDARAELRTRLAVEEVSTSTETMLDVNHPDLAISPFLQEEWKFGEAVDLTVGGRWDHSRERRDAVSPRGALVWRAQRDTLVKVLYGRAFRNPSAYELFYEDGTSAVANPGLRPERSTTYEVALDRRLGFRWNLTASAYTYQLRDHIVATYTAEGVAQYQNQNRILARGAELELRGTPLPEVDVVASVIVQRAGFVDGDRLVNSPGTAGKVRAAWRLPRMTVSTAAQFTGGRATHGGATVAAAALQDVTITAPVRNRLDFTLGIRNLFGTPTAHPIGLVDEVDTLAQPGRTMFVGAAWTIGG